MTLPLANAPILQAQAQLSLSARLQQIAEIVTVAGITIEHIIGVAHIRTVGLHKVV